MRAMLIVGCLFAFFLNDETVVAGVITKTNSTIGFFDASSGTRDLVFDLSDFAGGPTTVSDVNVSISFAKSNDDVFVASTEAIATGTPFFDEIEFVLISPVGTAYTLINNSLGDEIVPADTFSTFDFGVDGFQGTVMFDQSATDPVNSDPDVIAAGTFRPDDSTQGSLDIFNGESALGTWSLFIEDDFVFTGLSFYEYSLTITTSDVNAVPEPSSITLTGLGLLALGWGAARRRRK